MNGTGIIEHMITAHSAEIMERWASDAERAAAARGLTRPELMSIMPDYLTALARPGVEHPNHLELNLIEHQLSSRLRAGFNLDEIVDEFAILGRAILRMWSTEAPEAQPSIAEVDRLLAILQAAITFVTSIFTRHLLTDEQTEKRDLRLLAEAFRDSMDGTSPLSPARLAEALDVVMGAMKADTAALLLYDVTNHDLVMAASVGLADEGLTGYARSLGPGSLEGAIAASGKTSTIYDVQTTTLDVTDALRNSGISGVLGVRLPQYRALLGVMYIGLREQRTFAPAEMRRLEALAERLALHLDNAKLYAEVVDHVAALGAERRLRDQFVSLVAHDLRGPLSAARVATSLIASKKGAVSNVDDRYLEHLTRNLDRVEHMVTDLLDVERIHAGQHLAVTLQDSDLGAIASNVVTELSSEHPDRFVLQAEEGVRGTWDPSLLHRAIWNLATNALKYGAAETPILVTVTGTDDGARLVVHNEGTAIPPAEQATLFDLFSRAGASGAKGWGLGLTVVRGCAEAHGGSVHVDSEPGRGTTFTLELPANPRVAARSAA
jgi:signal transduction histidine kinase